MTAITAVPEKKEIKHGDVLNKAAKLAEQLETTSIQDMYDTLLGNIKEGTASSLDILIDVESHSFRFVEYKNENKSILATSFQRFSYTMNDMDFEFYDEMSILVKNPLISDLVILEKAIPLLMSMAINGTKTPVSVMQKLAKLLQ